MPKPMLNPQMQTQNRLNGENLLSASQPKTQNAQKQQMDKMVLDRTLRKKRSKEYMQAIQKLDAGGHTHNQKQVDEIIGEITNEFPEVKLEGLLIGFVAICYLGKPYEVHTLDLSGRIIQHFQAGQSLPDGMEKARGIAMHGGYSFIEVYTDCVRAVSSGGNVSVIYC
jgi:hypothetical protein